MLKEFIKTLLLIFFAEIGDKTQIMLMMYSTRYSMLQMLLGIFIGVILNHGLAIVIGIYVSSILNVDFLQLFAGLIFILFGMISFLKDNKEEEKKPIFKYSIYGPVIFIALTFFLGELGDKTQLTAMTLAMNSKYPFLILLGSTLGMILVGVMGIVIGTTLTKMVPLYIIKIISGIIFIVFGYIKLFIESNIVVFNSFNLGILTVGILFTSIFLIQKLIWNR